MVRIALTLALVLGAGPLATAAELIKALPDKVVPGSYIVVLREGEAVKPGARTAGLTVSQVALSLAVLHRGSITHVFEHALQGFAARLSEEEARALAQD